MKQELADLEDQTLELRNQLEEAKNEKFEFIDLNKKYKQEFEEKIENMTELNK